MFFVVFWLVFQKSSSFCRENEIPKTKNQKQMDHLLTLKRAKIGPLFNFTAYIYIFLSHLSISSIYLIYSSMPLSNAWSQFRRLPWKMGYHNTTAKLMVAQGGGSPQSGIAMARLMILHYLAALLESVATESAERKLSAWHCITSHPGAAQHAGLPASPACITFMSSA